MPLGGDRAERAGLLARLLPAGQAGSSSGFVMRGALLSMSLRVVSLALGFAAHILLSRLLGLAAYGQYVIWLGWALVLTVPGRLGLDNSAIRYATLYLDEDRRDRLRGFLRFSTAAIVVFSGALGAIAVMLVGSVAGDPGLRLAVATAVLIPILSLLSFLSVFIRSARRVFAAQFYDQVLRPVLLIVLIAGWAIAGLSLDAGAALLLTALGGLGALAALAVHLRRAISFGAAADYSAWPHWAAFSWPLLFMALAQESMNQMGVLMLGVLADPSDAGLFAAAWRVASFLPFALVALTTVSGPVVASAFHSGRLDEIRQIATLNARIAFGFAVAVTLVLAFAGPWMLRLFGAEFDAAAGTLAVLLVGGLANAFTGIVGYLMMLTGHERAALVILMVALVVGLVSNLLLIPVLGPMGAAIASVLATLSWNGAMTVYVWRRLRIDTTALGMSPR